MLRRRFKRISNIVEGRIRRLTTKGVIGEKRSDILHVEPYGFTSGPRPGFLGLEEYTSEDERQSIITNVRPAEGKPGVYANPGHVIIYTDADNGVDRHHRVHMDADTGGIRVHGVVVSLEGSLISLASDKLILQSNPLISESEEMTYNVPTHWVDCTEEVLSRPSDAVVTDAAMRFRLQNNTVWVRGNLTVTMDRSQSPLHVIMRLPVESLETDPRVQGGGFCAYDDRNGALFIDQSTDPAGARIRMPPTHRQDDSSRVVMRCNVEYTYTI